MRRERGYHPAMRPALHCLSLLALCAAALVPRGSATAEGSDGAVGFATLEESEIAERLGVIAGPDMEGRDSPSDGQARAAAYLVERFVEFGLEPAADSREVMARHGQDGPDSQGEGGTFYRPFGRELPAPDPEGCSLSLIEGGELTREFELGRDFQPVHRAGGSVRGELMFGGFAIDSTKYKYNDLKGRRPRGKVVLFFEGEPRHPKKFEGPEVTSHASLWNQLAVLREAGAVGALVVQRRPEGADSEAQHGLDFRTTWAQWQGVRNERQPSKSLPALHISMEVASALLGVDAEKLAAKMDRSAKPQKVKLKGREVSFDSTTKRSTVRLDNVVGVLRGSDPELREEYVLLGAHYDHIGYGPRARIGYGADDNGSGVAAFLEVAQALAADPPRRSVIFASFTAEEDGLFGSKALAEELPVPREALVAMVNLDQIGFGPSRETSVLGTAHNPELADVLKRARKLHDTGLKKVHFDKRKELGGEIRLFERSDHYSFHSIGVPTLFFFEGLPLSDNKDYHTWRDTVRGVDLAKVTGTARLVFNTLWILANDDDRPPPPRG